MANSLRAERRRCQDEYSKQQAVENSGYTDDEVIWNQT